MTKKAKEILEKNGIKVTFETLTDKIINRTGTDICPMEKAVMDIEDIDDQFENRGRAERTFDQLGDFSATALVEGSGIWSARLAIPVRTK